MNDESIDINTIRSMEHKPLQYAINSILPHGLFILAGSPKIGKSWLVLDLCIAVATGGDTWGYRANQNGVLYYALEDNWRRINDRTGLTGATDGNWVLEKVKRTENHAKLTIDNRDTEGFCFDLKLNPDTCHWEYVGNNTGVDNADEDIAILVNDFLQNEWQGTATELCKSLREQDPKANITPTNLSKQLRRIDKFMQKEFCIKIDFKKSGSVKSIMLQRFSQD